MNNIKIRTLIVMVILLSSNILSISPFNEPSNIQSPILPEVSSSTSSKDVLIINDPHKYAYFGWYKPTAFSVNIWGFLNATIFWASNFKFPNETSIIFFYESNDSHATEVYNWLIGVGYTSSNIELHPTIDVEILASAYYENVDLVIYWNINGYNVTNIINANVPFLTVSATHTDEMGIGIGTTTSNSSNDTFFIVNNNYYPTESYALGPVLFDDSYQFEATEATVEGRVLIKAEVESVATQIEMSIVQNVSVLADGSANMTFTITIPESPLATILRDSFFSNASSLEKDVEYDVPDNITVIPKSDIENGVIDVSLQGDVSDGNGKVDKEDIDLITENLGVKLGDKDYNPNLDLNNDGKTDMRDVAIAAHNYGKSLNTTGSLFIAGYYNNTNVNCTDVYYQGPEDSGKINVSASGYIWYNVLPGDYTVFGTFNGTEKNISVVVEAKKVTYAQLEFGGVPSVSRKGESAPVKEVFHQGINMEQLILLGFDVNILQSKIVPLSSNNETKISLEAQSSSLASYLGALAWRINIGPMDENETLLATEFIFTKIEYMMLMLQSLPGDQVYVFNWHLGFDLPVGSSLQDISKLNLLNWTIDLGEGNFIQANVTATSGRVFVDEVMVVTERNITANESYLETAFSEYKKFSINYSYSAPPSGIGSQINQGLNKPESDWSKSWTYIIAPKIPKKTWSLGPLAINLKAIPVLSLQWYMGWERTWAFGKLKWFETWMKITPSITVEASITATARYTKTWSYTFLTWSTRFTFWAGSVVVWANLKFRVTASLTVDAFGQISIVTSATVSAWYKAGVKWTSDRGWSTIWSHGSGTRRTGPTISGSAGLTVTPSVACRLSFLFYDVGGPFVEAVPYAPISIRWYSNQANTWSISLKFKIITGVTLAGWLQKILKLSAYSKIVADWTLMSWNGNWP